MDKISTEIHNLVKNEAIKLKSKAIVEFIKENDGYEFSEKDSFLIDTINKLNKFGVNPKLIRSWGCYEANIFAAHGIRMLNIADGSLDNHTNKERIRVKDLERLADLVYSLVI